MCCKRYLFYIVFLAACFLSANAEANSKPDHNLVRLEIPKIALSIPVEKVSFAEELGTWDISNKTGAVYWLEGTPHPDYGGNTVIAAHYMETGEPGPLFRVRDLQKGDEIYLYSENIRYTYRVDRYQYIPDTWMEHIKNRPDSLTLFTCSGFNWDTGIWEQRVVVLADLYQIDFVDP